MTHTESIAALTAALPKLASSDASFASSLLAQYHRKGFLSDKQWPWVEKLTAKADAPKVGSVEIGSMAGILALFDRAQKHLKRPAVVLNVSGREIKLSLASERARVPGSINVADNASYGDGNWYGRILRDGNFEKGFNAVRNTNSAPADLVEHLRRFAAEPAKVAAEHGKLTGKCCFCDRALSDERSTAVGYGRVCASHFGLAWGDAKQSEIFKAEAEKTFDDAIEPGEGRAARMMAASKAERQEFHPDPGELSQDRWNETHY